MRKEASLPVRLDPDDKRLLQAAADRLGMTVSALVRLLVRSFVEEYERSGGRVALPPEWRRTDDAAAGGGEPARMAAESRAKYRET